MDYGYFQTSKGDSDYRSKVKETLDHSRLGIEIIGNDLSNINYPEILEALKRTRTDGLSIRVYSTNAPNSIIDFLKASDITVYQGEMKFNPVSEYIIRDGNKIIESEVSEDMRTAYWTNSETDIQQTLEAFEVLLSNPSTKILYEMKNLVKERSPKDMLSDDDREKLK